MISKTYPLNVPVKMNDSILAARKQNSQNKQADAQSATYHQVITLSFQWFQQTATFNVQQMERIVGTDMEWYLCPPDKSKPILIHSYLICNTAENFFVGVQPVDA